MKGGLIIQKLIIRSVDNKVLSYLCCLGVSAPLTYYMKAKFAFSLSRVPLISRFLPLLNQSCWRATVIY